jgi:pantoate--beta-alanine ligase
MSRPCHFQGVCTVVTIFLNIIRPDFAFFGQKDAQQSLIVKRMVRDLAFDTEVVILPTVREDSGLAMSSRNLYLNSEDGSGSDSDPPRAAEGRESYKAGERSAAN